MVTRKIQLHVKDISYLIKHANLCFQIYEVGLKKFSHSGSTKTKKRK